MDHPQILSTSVEGEHVAYRKRQKEYPVLEIGMALAAATVLAGWVHNPPTIKRGLILAVRYAVVLSAIMLTALQITTARADDSDTVVGRVTAIASGISTDANTPTLSYRVENSGGAVTVVLAQEALVVDRAGNEMVPTSMPYSALVVATGRWSQRGVFIANRIEFRFVVLHFDVPVNTTCWHDEGEGSPVVIYYFANGSVLEVEQKEFTRAECAMGKGDFRWDWCKRAWSANRACLPIPSNIEPVS